MNSRIVIGLLIGWASISAGCSNRLPPQAPEAFSKDAFDDSRCRQHTTQGTEAYLACRENLTAQREKALQDLLHGTEGAVTAEVIDRLKENE